MKTKFEDLSKELRDELFKRHTHNELVNDPSALIYYEEDVIEIINMAVQQERNKAIDDYKEQLKRAVHTLYNNRLSVSRIAMIELIDEL